MIVTVHDAAGRILRQLEAPTIEDILLNVAPDEGFLLGEHPLTGGYAEGGTFVPCPPPPSPDWTWDYGAKAWVPPTPEALAEKLQAARAGAKLTKVEFLKRCREAHILTGPERLAASKGEIPASFQPVVDMMSPEQREDAESIWAAATEIDRLDPFINAVAQLAGISDATLDALFEVAP